jgi:ParB/RepB/Spo0J family partition protein
MSIQQIKSVKISDIVADSTWNVRTPGWEADNPDETVQSFVDLKESIRTRGIETPLVVRPVGGRSKKFNLVSGFRRFQCATELELDAVPVIVREYGNEIEARSANLRENVEREGLTVADLIWGCGQILDAYQEAGEEKTQAELAKEFGVGQAMVSHIVKIYSGLLPQLLSEWRTSTLKISYKQVLPIAKLDRVDQPVAWRAMIAGKASGATDGRTKAGGTEKLKGKAQKLALVIAKLAYHGVDPHEPGFAEFPWAEFFDVEVKANERKAMSKAAQSVYDDYFVEEEGEGDLDEE